MARLFNGSSEYLISSASPVSAVPHALVCWARSNDGAQDNQIPFGISIAGNSGLQRDMFSINFDTNGSIPQSLRAISRNAAGGYYLAGTSVFWVVNTWHHCAAVTAGVADRRVFIDGGNKISTTTDASSYNTIDQVTVGSGDESGIVKYFDGDVAEAAIYDLSLWPGATDAAKANAFEAIVPSLGAGYSPLFFPLGLVAYYPLIRGMNDIVGGYNLAVGSGSSVSPHPPIIYPSQAHIITAPSAAAAPVVKPIPPKLILSKLLRAGPVGIAFAGGLIGLTKLIKRRQKLM